VLYCLVSARVQYDEDMRIFIQVVVVVVQLSPTFVSSMTVQIGAFDTLNEVTAIINDAYRIGESGILMDTPDRPFYRVTAEEVQQMIARKGILTLSIDGQVVGCIKVNVVDNNVAEWGCLAVMRSCQGKGYGTMLVNAIEQHIQSVLNCQVAQLELLAPSSWKHSHKERLRDWYQRLGYALAKETYEESTVRLPQGSSLADRFVLATDGDFTCYQKKL
jgi:N-acetylglutamate synthase-like GNAT family acetyltransferase